MGAAWSRGPNQKETRQISEVTNPNCTKIGTDVRDIMPKQQTELDHVTRPRPLPITWSKSSGGRCGLLPNYFGLLVCNCCHGLVYTPILCKSHVLRCRGLQVCYEVVEAKQSGAEWKKLKPQKTTVDITDQPEPAAPVTASTQPTSSSMPTVSTDTGAPSLRSDTTPGHADITRLGTVTSDTNDSSDFESDEETTAGETLCDQSTGKQVGVAQQQPPQLHGSYDETFSISTHSGVGDCQNITVCSYTGPEEMEKRDPEVVATNVGSITGNESQSEDEEGDRKFELNDPAQYSNVCVDQSVIETVE